MPLITTDQFGGRHSIGVDHFTGGLMVAPAQNQSASSPRPLIATDQLGNQFALSIDSTDGSLILTPTQNQLPTDNSFSVTALSIISSALRLIGVLAAGEQADTATANDALMVLDQMLDGWNSDRLSIYTTNADDYALVPGQQAYTVGIGGDFNTTRPAQIDSMSVILLSNPANPIEIPIAMYTVDDWRTKLPVKNVPGTFPLVCYDDGGFPLRTLNFWPIPQQANSVRIYSWLGLGLPSTLQTSLSFPPGYAEASRYNLAVRLSAEFGAAVSPTVQRIAIESLARVKTMNAPKLTLKSDLAAGRSGSNYRAEWFGIP